MRALAGLTLCAILAAPATPVEAQRRPRERGFIAVNGSAQIVPSTQTDTFTYEQYVETATVNARYPSITGAQFEVAAGMRVARRVGIGAAIARGSSSGRGRVNAEIPHPFFDNRHRAVEGTGSGLSRTQTAAHLQLYYERTVTPRLRLRLAGGPSYVRVSQDLIASIEIDEEYPFDVATFRRASAASVDGSGWGVHAGLDLSWMFTRRLGIGGQIRYSAAPVDLNAAGGRNVSWDGGGLESGGGLRVVF